MGIPQALSLLYNELCCLTSDSCSLDSACSQKDTSYVVSSLQQYPHPTPLPQSTTPARAYSSWRLEEIRQFGRGGEGGERMSYLKVSRWRIINILPLTLCPLCIQHP